MLLLLVIVTNWSPVVNEEFTGPTAGNVRVAVLFPLTPTSVDDNVTFIVPAVIVWALTVF
jgi:hypothetical protein